MSVCLSVRQDISGTTSAISTKIFVHFAYGRGSVFLRQDDEIPRRRGNLEFSSPLAMHCNAFAANDVMRSITDHSVAAGNGVMGVHSAGEV